MFISEGNIVTCLFLILILNILSVYYTSINYKLKLCSSTDEDLKCKKTCHCKVSNKTDNVKVKNQVSGQVDESTIFEIKKDLISNELNIGNLKLSNDKILQFMFCKQQFTTSNNTDYTNFQQDFYIPKNSEVTCNPTTDLCCGNYVALTKTPGDRTNQFSTEDTNLVVPFYLESNDIAYPKNYADKNSVGIYINNLQLVHRNFSISDTNITNNTNFLIKQEPEKHDNTYNIIDDVFYMSNIVNSYIDKLNTSETKPVPICIEPSIITEPEECKSDMYGFYKHKNGENSRDPVNIYDSDNYNDFQTFITNPNSSTIKYYFCNSRMSFDTAKEKSNGSNGGNIYIDNTNLITESSQPINTKAIKVTNPKHDENRSYGANNDNSAGSTKRKGPGEDASLLCSRFLNIPAQDVYNNQFFRTYGFLK